MLYVAKEIFMIISRMCNVLFSSLICANSPTLNMLCEHNATLSHCNTMWTWSAYGLTLWWWLMLNAPTTYLSTSYLGGVHSRRRRWTRFLRQEFVWRLQHAYSMVLQGGSDDSCTRLRRGFSQHVSFKA